MLHLPPIEFVQQLGNRLVELGQTEEGPIPQPGQDPTLNHLNADLDRGLITLIPKFCKSRINKLHSEIERTLD